MLYRWETELLQHFKELQKNNTATYDSKTAKQIAQRPAKLNEMVGGTFGMLYISAQRLVSEYGCLQFKEEDDGMEIVLHHDASGSLLEVRAIEYMMLSFTESWEDDGKYWEMPVDGTLRSEVAEYANGVMKAEVVRSQNQFLGFGTNEKLQHECIHSLRQAR